MGKKIRTIIVEDELPIREEILELALRIERLQIVGVGKNGKDLESLLLEKKPDLALLDIELPIQDSMAVLAEQKNLPHLIFISAYEMYAPRAFEMEAVDYLVKPVKEDRFNQAVKRAIDRIHSDNTNDNQSNKASKILWVRENDRIIPVPVNEIIYLEASNKTTYINVRDGKQFSVLRPLSSILGQFESSSFFLQIHRKYAVNGSKILEMHPLFHGRHEITIKGLDQKLPVSRRYASRILTGLKRA
ncbi:MAG: LytTR family DNA-binding domain-containing protein [Spirochaetia bacterium]|nr:LytTR family DNA-binding domain-containing protein [Spirochaetia bacterium]